MKRLIALAALLPLAQCAHENRVSATHAHYELGAPYQAGGIWRYPAEQFTYDETGLASVDAPAHAPSTADGERYDPAALAAAHPTLQLPAIARVTNLENGRAILVRLNERGPANPGRLVSLTPHAARLLGIGAGEAARVRVTLDTDMSMALAVQYHSPSSRLAISTAPRGAVQEADLPPPPGIAQRALRQVASSRPAERAAFTERAIPERLPEQVIQLPPRRGELFIRTGVFSRYEYAAMQRNRLSEFGAKVERILAEGHERDTVSIGPIATVSEADALLDRVLRAGVTDARIIVE